MDRCAAACLAATAGDVSGPAAEGARIGWRTLGASGGGDQLDPWSRTHLDQLAELEAVWAHHAAGDTLVHADIRADNLLMTERGVVVVDWPWACRGAAFADVVLFAPSVAMQGGPQPADLIAMSRSGRAAATQAEASGEFAPNTTGTSGRVFSSSVFALATVAKLHPALV